MSSPHPDEDLSPSLQPPSTANPLMGAVTPVLIVLALILGGYFFVIPLFKDVKRTEEKMRSIAKPIPAPTAVPFDSPPR